MRLLGLLYVCNMHGPLWFYSKILWPMLVEGVPQWERKSFFQNMMYLLELEILICIDIHLPFYFYDLAFSKHLCTYSLNMHVLCLSNPFMHSSFASKHKSLEHKCFLKIIICKNNSISTFFPFLSMLYKLDYALETQKQRAIRNCLAFYNRPFRTWWNTNYIAHVQKSKVEKTKRSQTWPKQSNTALYSILKLVRRIGSFE